jgi:hypothetical protein
MIRGSSSALTAHAAAVDEGPSGVVRLLNRAPARPPPARRTVKAAASTSQGVSSELASLAVARAAVARSAIVRARA